MDDTFALPAKAKVSSLTELLFDGHFKDLHEQWMRLFCGEPFRYRDGLPLSERSERAYERLRIINNEIESVENLIKETDRLMSLHEWAAMVDGSLTTLATIHYNLFLGSILHLDASRAVDLTPFIQLRRYGTVLITELGYGNNAADLETTATYRPETDSFDLHTPTINAQKFMPNTATPGGPKTGLVAARLIVAGQDCGVFLFLVPLSDERGPRPGIGIRLLSETPGWAVDHAITWFDHVTLPRSALLTGDHSKLADDGVFRCTVGNRRRRFLRSIHRVTTGKLCLSAAAIGGARAALAIAVRYGHRRHTFAPAGGDSVPIFAYRCHQTRLLRPTASAYAATFLLRDTTRHFLAVDGDETAEVDVLIAATKGWITWRARDIVTECRERCGAQGLLSVNRIVDWFMPIEGLITAEGDNLVVWTKAAADMLTGRGYRRPQASSASAGSLTDRDFLLDLLVRHELHCFEYARSQLKPSSTGALHRWNRAVNPALDLVDAFATRRAAEAFLGCAARADGATRTVLEQLFRLFVLQSLAPHAGLLLANGHLTAASLRDLAASIDDIAAELAPHALSLVEAFAIPDEILQAPIATGDYGAVHDDPAGPWRR